MATPRIYCQQELAIDTTVTLDHEGSHHLSTVLRVQTGASVCLFNGDGFDYAGQVEKGGKATRIAIQRAIPNTSESALHTCLVQGISRGDRMDYLLQKSVELGVNRVIAFHADRSGRRLTTERQLKKLNHWKAVGRSATEQTGRSCLTTIEFADNLDYALRIASTESDNSHTDTLEGKWILQPQSEKSLATLIREKPELNRVLLMIGPESGFSESENSIAIDNGFLNAGLGPRVLRTETAPVVALSVLQTLCGDLK